MSGTFYPCLRPTLMSMDTYLCPMRSHLNPYPKNEQLDALIQKSTYIVNVVYTLCHK